MRFGLLLDGKRPLIYLEKIRHDDIKEITVNGGLMTEWISSNFNIGKEEVWNLLKDVVKNDFKKEDGKKYVIEKLNRYLEGLKNGR